MKRIMCVILVTLLVVSLFSFVGCSQITNNKKQIEDLQAKANLLQNKINSLKSQLTIFDGNYIEYTAQSPDVEQAPIYEMPEKYLTVAEFDHHEDSSVTFAGFLEYYQKEIKPKHDKDFYLIAPIASEIDDHPNMYRIYGVLAERFDEQQIVNPMIYERLMMYDIGLGDDFVFPNMGEGGVNNSINLLIYLVPVSKEINKTNIYLEFGIKTSNDYFGKKYINIYFGEECIGTCYYETNAFVSKNWFQRYFYEYIVRG